jgi:uncharacterized protein (TIGR03435 family)
MRSSALRLVFGILGFAFVTAAQTQPDLSRASFEVASVRPSPSGNGVRGGCRGIDSKYAPTDDAAPPLGRCVITDARLSHLIMIAWQLNAIAVIRNAPDWVIGGNERFNIQAKADDPKATEAQLLDMLRKLLEDRFRLKFHREEHQESGFALVVAKSGPKLRESSDDEVTTLGPFNNGNPTITISARKYSMPMFASFLSTFGPGTVKDETALQDFYDFNLTWNEKEGPSVFTALQQIGLRLEPRKVPVSYFVIDSAQRPDAN